MRDFSRILLRVVLVSVSLSPAEAQILYGSLVGNVIDSTGGSVVGAKVQAVNSATGLAREAVVNDRGAFS